MIKKLVFNVAGKGAKSAADKNHSKESPTDHTRFYALNNLPLRRGC